MFPNTIHWMFTAVPFRPVIWLILRYLMALGLSHDSKTALIDNSNCFFGSVHSQKENDV